MRMKRKKIVYLKLRRLFVGCTALQVERQQAFQDVVVGGGGGEVGPAVGGCHGLVESGVGLGQPGWALVVELGEGALGQLLFKTGAGNGAVGVWAGGQAQGHHFGQGLRPLGRVEPGLAQVVQPLGSLGDGAGVGLGAGGQTGGNACATLQRVGALVRGVGGREPLGEGEGFKAGFGVVGGTTAFCTIAMNGGVRQ